MDFALISLGAAAAAFACSSWAFFLSDNLFFSFGFATGLIGAAVSYGFAMSGFGGGVAFSTISERREAAFVCVFVFDVVERPLVGGEPGGDAVIAFLKGEETAGAVRGRAPIFVAFLTYTCFGAEPMLKVGPEDDTEGVMGAAGSASAALSSTIFRRFEVSGFAAACMFTLEDWRG